MSVHRVVSEAAGDEMAAALELEQLDVDLYRSVRLWQPINGRGAFGGQVVGQATWAATKSVAPTFVLHSTHCYFITFGDCTLPIIYAVERIRDGRSYATRTVKAIQRGKVIFTLTCSFQVPENEQPSMHPPMPTEVEGNVVPKPEDCQPQEERITALLNTPGITIPPRFQTYLERLRDERAQSRIEVRSALPSDRDDYFLSTPIREQAFWMRCRGAMPVEDAFRRCVIAFLSDLQFIGTAPKALSLYTRDGPRLAMLASLDHTIHYYHPVDPSQWLLFYMAFESAGAGRALVHGSIYSQDGKLAAVCSQEGVVRAQPPKTKL